MSIRCLYRVIYDKFIVAKQLQNDLVLLQAKIPRELRDEFMKAVKDSDDNASRLIRLWVRDYLRKTKEKRIQGDFFDRPR